MNSIKSGDIFVFQTNLKYGLIQVVEKSKVAGYHVRVFCDLIDNLESKTIEGLINNGDFYYLRDFYEYELINKSECKISYELSVDAIMPKYMRANERKLNGDLFWYIIDTNTGKVVKKIKRFANELLGLSPYRTWGIDYIKTRWNENFSLDKWTDDLENQWYVNYLRMLKSDE